ncbi:TadE/TadG family type IV pilus assembly protein [Pseudoneobacillus sp. C159]
MVRNEKGQSIVEMALVLPVLLLLLVGIFDFGRTVYSFSKLHMAAQETVRKAGLGATDLEITQFAKNYLQQSDGTLQVTITPTQANRKSGEYVKVTLKNPLKLNTPLLSKIIPLPEYIEANSTVRVE